MPIPARDETRTWGPLNHRDARINPRRSPSFLDFSLAPASASRVDSYLKVTRGITTKFGYVPPALGLILYLVVLVFFASWATSHVLLCLTLGRSQRILALTCLVVVPLAPYVGLRQGLRRLPTVWLTACSLYLCALGLSLR